MLLTIPILVPVELCKGSGMKAYVPYTIVWHDLNFPSEGAFEFSCAKGLHMSRVQLHGMTCIRIVVHIVMAGLVCSDSN